MACVRKCKCSLKDTPTPISSNAARTLDGAGSSAKELPRLRQGLSIVSVFTKQVGRVKARESCPVTVAPGDGIQDSDMNDGQQDKQLWCRQGFSRMHSRTGRSQGKDKGELFTAEVLQE